MMKAIKNWSMCNYLILIRGEGDGLEVPEAQE